MRQIYIPEDTSAHICITWKPGILVFLLIMTVLLLISCKETPVKYYICDTNRENCEVAARFDTLWACERHKVFATAYCDSESVPGKIICDAEKEPENAVSYCED